MREVYLTDDPKAAALLLDKAIADCGGDVVVEICALSNTPRLLALGDPILADHATGTEQRSKPKAQPLSETREAVAASSASSTTAARASPCRRCQLSEPSSTATHPNPLSPSYS